MPKLPDHSIRNNATAPKTKEMARGYDFRFYVSEPAEQDSEYRRAGEEDGAQDTYLKIRALVDVSQVRWNEVSEHHDNEHEHGEEGRQGQQFPVPHKLQE
jgi:hypothetical protein